MATSSVAMTTFQTWTTTRRRDRSASIAVWSISDRDVLIQSQGMVDRPLRCQRNIRSRQSLPLRRFQCQVV